MGWGLKYDALSMPSSGKRRSDRIYVAVPIRVSGTDARNISFLDETQTLVISQHGACILLNRPLVPEQDITVFSELTHQDANSRVVGPMGEDGRGIHYGIEFQDPQVNIWGIEFPSLEDSENAVGRIVLECGHCHYREIVYLTEMEAEVFETNRGLTRTCRRCTLPGIWNEATVQEPTEVEEPEEQPRTQNDRRHFRARLKLTACIRFAQFGEEVVKTQDVSRGGFAFKSQKVYGVGSLIEVALPYSPQGLNIFSPARIVHVRELPEEKSFRYGVMYVPVHKGWSKDLNIPTLK
jgi:PilZ domain